MTQHQQILKDLIKQSGLSQKDYATKHGICHVKFNHWVTGFRNIQFKTLERLALEDGKKLIINIEELKINH